MSVREMIATATPIEIDTELARIWGAIDKSQHHMALERRMLADVERGIRYAGGARYTPEAIEFRIGEHEAEIARLKAEAAPFEAEYAARRWNRYFLVTNGNGHVHRGMNCNTCYPTTSYAWLIDLADCDEDAMIEEWGERACTVCFPTAPTNPFYNRPARIDREAREARDAEKLARESAKAAKAIAALDGTPLKDSSGYTLKTKVAARNELSSLISYASFYGPERYTEDALRIAAALRANAPEIDVDRVIANALKKAAKEGAGDTAAVAALLK